MRSQHPGSSLAEAPARRKFSPRLRSPDFLKQLFRWAVQYADDGEDVNKPPMRCDVIDVSSVLSVGFTVSIMRYNEAGKLESECDLECIMDEEVVQGYDVVGMDEHGFPKMQTMDGEEKLVKGKNFLIRCAAARRRAPAQLLTRRPPARRDKNKPVPAHHVETVKKLLSNMFEAVNKYYRCVCERRRLRWPGAHTACAALALASAKNFD